jgi:predicted amidohydrolase YtcJ
MRWDVSGWSGLVLLALAGCAAGDAGEADVVFRGGTVWTGEAGGMRAEALAVQGARILVVGTEEEVAEVTGPETRMVELAGRTLLPGFVDSHTHFLSGGFQLSSVDLRDAATPEEFASRIAEFARSLQPGEWITGGDWDHELWGGALPRKEWVDSLTPDHPVFVSRLDGHMALANTLALKSGGVTDETADPPGGSLVRDSEGSLTGILRDNAMALVQRTVPGRSLEEWDRALEAAAGRALSLGVTQVHDVDGWASLEVYRRAHAEGRLPLRVYAAVPVSGWERLRDFIQEEGRGDERLWWGGLKGFVDGSLGSTTAWFYEPYTDDPTTAGLLTTDTAQLRSWIEMADEAELQAMIHAIGDQANDWLLDVYEGLGPRNGARDRRFRIEHAQHLTRDAIRRIAELDVIPAMQPYHAADDGRWAERRIGPDRIRTTYAFRSLLDAGASVALGSDWTVAPLDPLLGIDAAVTRRTIDGANPDGWVPEERISLEEALMGYTRNAAHAGFSDSFTGTLAAGKMADLVVLSGDLFAQPVSRMSDLQVDMTWVAGEEIFRREGVR